MRNFSKESFLRLRKKNLESNAIEEVMEKNYLKRSREIFKNGFGRHLRLLKLGILILIELREIWISSKFRKL